MTDAGWAERQVRTYLDRRISKVSDVILAEHARAIRMVKAEIKRVELDQHTYTAGFKMTLLKELQSLLSKFERGRGGKG